MLESPLPSVPFYTVVEPLGRGAIGEVFLAVREGASRPCVLKIPRIANLPKTEVRARFRREAQVAAYLHHPNIAEILDARFEEDEGYIAVEWVAGIELEALVERHASRGQLVPRPTTLAIVQQALAGLAHAHRAVGPDGQPLRLVHRDLSFRNLMLGFDGRVKVIDFGLASAEIDNYQTVPGAILGTPRFWSPELVRIGADQVDQRTDVYSIGAILFELLVGRALIRETQLADMIDRILTARAPRFQDLPGVPAELAEVVITALAPQPEDRWADASQLSQALADATKTWVLPSESGLAVQISALFPDDEARARARMERARPYGVPMSRATTQTLTEVRSEALDALAREGGLIAPTLPAPVARARDESERKTIEIHVEGAFRTGAELMISGTPTPEAGGRVIGGSPTPESRLAVERPPSDLGEPVAGNTITDLGPIPLDAFETVRETPAVAAPRSIELPRLIDEPAPFGEATLPSAVIPRTAFRRTEPRTLVPPPPPPTLPPLPSTSKASPLLTRDERRRLAFRIVWIAAITFALAALLAVLASRVGL